LSDSPRAQSIYQTLISDSHAPLVTTPRLVRLSQNFYYFFTNLISFHMLFVISVTFFFIYLIYLFLVFVWVVLFQGGGGALGSPQAVAAVGAVALSQQRSLSINKVRLAFAVFILVLKQNVDFSSLGSADSQSHVGDSGGDRRGETSQVFFIHFCICICVFCA
jgi:hypothetical protein